MINGLRSIFSPSTDEHSFAQSFPVIAALEARVSHGVAELAKAFSQASTDGVALEGAGLGGPQMNFSTRWTWLGIRADGLADAADKEGNTSLANTARVIGKTAKDNAKTEAKADAAGSAALDADAEETTGLLDALAGLLGFGGSDKNGRSALAPSQQGAHILTATLRTAISEDMIHALAPAALVAAAVTSPYWLPSVLATAPTWLPAAAGAGGAVLLTSPHVASPAASSPGMTATGALPTL